MDNSNKNPEVEHDGAENIDDEYINNTMKDVKWQPQHTKILVDWADKAMCYRWLHTKCTHKYTLANAWFTIPVIIISTLTGVGNFAQERFPEDYRQAAVIIIGGFNILAGIITTIQQFLKITEQMEGHRISGIHWGKFYRNIKVELAKSPDERINVGQMMKICKEEFDRLMESSPDIDEVVVKAFKNSFKHSSEYAKISKPEICDELVSISKFTFDDKDLALSKQDIEKYKKKKILMSNIKKIENYKKTFLDVQGREASKDEIIDHFDDTMKVEDITEALNSISGNKDTRVNVDQA